MKRRKKKGLGKKLTLDLFSSPKKKTNSSPQQPQQEYQRLRDASVAIIREMGIECGGSNVQMAVNPADGEVQIIEMNPRVSRSSAVSLVDFLTFFRDLFPFVSCFGSFGCLSFPVA